MADSLFDPTDDNQFDENKDYLAELTKPGGKFDRSKYPSDEDMYKALAKSTAHGDRYITFKNKEFDDLKEDFLKVRAENVTKEKLEDLLARRPLDNEPASQPPAGNVDKPSLDPKDIETAVERKLLEIEAKRTETSNMEKVESRLRERFGDSAKSETQKRMNTLGISNEDLKFLARRSPEAALNALGINQQAQESSGAPPRSSLRSDSFSPQADIRDALFYEKMRTTNPKLYFSEKQSVQRLKDMDSPDFLTRYNQRQ